MGNLTIALIFVITLNAIMFLTQASCIALNPDNCTIFYTNEGQLLNQFDKNKGVGEAVLDTENTYNNLPSIEGDVSPDTGNFFTDIFSSIKKWFADTMHLGYLSSIVSAPYNLLKSAGLPNDFCFAIGTLWYGVSFFVVVAFIFGRDS